jgi:hypothetical protein
LKLGSDRVGIDDDAAIERTNDAPHTNRSVLPDFNFCDLRHIRRERELEGDAAADAFRQWLSPAGLLGGKCKDGFGARGLVEEREPIRHWVLLRRGGQLVHEAFNHKDGMQRADAAPEGSWNAGRLHPHILDVDDQLRPAVWRNLADSTKGFVCIGDEDLKTILNLLIGHCCLLCVQSLRPAAVLM